MLIVWTTLAWLVPFHTLALVWLIPLVIVGYMTNIRGFTQHGMTDAHDPLLASRSMHPNRIVSLLLLNENLHLEHHLFPEIPSYNLPRLQRLIEPRLPRRSWGGRIWHFSGDSSGPRSLAMKRPSAWRGERRRGTHESTHH